METEKNWERMCDLFQEHILSNGAEGGRSGGGSLGKGWI